MSGDKLVRILEGNMNTVRKIQQVVLGNILFQTWFDSRYPDELVAKYIETLYVCRWCFRYTEDRDAHVAHAQLCEHKHTPIGTQVYNHGGYSVWEVDGEQQKLFAQNLSLFAKLFLDHKSVFFDVSSFLYYPLVFTNPLDSNDYHILGYFSKEKVSWDANNLACILIFPPYQHRQLGKLLMGISYKLSAWDWEGGIIGGPEKPLSEMGYRSYVRFWEERIARFLLSETTGHSVAHAGGVSSSKGKKPQKKPTRETVTIREISQGTGMLVEDVITTLKSMGIVEPEKPTKRRKKDSHIEDNESPEPAVISMKNTLEWVKAHNINIGDPVRDEGFVGEWAHGKARGSTSGSSMEDE